MCSSDLGNENSWKPGTVQKNGNTPQYANNVYNNYLKLKNGTSQNTSSQTSGYQPPQDPNASLQQSGNSQNNLGYPAPVAPPPASTSSDNSQNNSQPESLGGKALDVVKGVGNFLFPIVGDVYNDITGQSKKTALQQVGDTALSALPFIPGLGEVGEGVKGVEAVAEGGEALADATKGGGILDAIKGSPVAKGAITGYGAGVASNLSQGQGLGQSLLPNANTIGGAALGGLTPVALKGLGNFATKISGIDPQVYTELSKMGVEANPQDAKLYDQYIQATKEHAINLRATSPLTMAANNLDTAAEKINTITDEAGKAVGEAKKAGATIPIAQPDVANIGKNFAQQVSDKYGLNLVSDETGKVTATPIAGNMRQVAPSDVSRIENVATQLNQLYANGEKATVKNATEVMDNLNNLVDFSKQDRKSVV